MLKVFMIRQLKDINITRIQIYLYFNIDELSIKKFNKDYFKDN